MAKPIKTAADFETLLVEAMSKGEAPIRVAKGDMLTAVICEQKGRKFRLIGKTTSGTDIRVSIWQPTEEEAVHDAIARAFC